jgi:alcohol dehydrogenase class IV
MTHRMADFGITEEDFDQIAADALDDEVMVNTPRRPAAAGIRSILLATP